MKIAITVEVLQKEKFAGVEHYIHRLTRQLVHRNELDLTLIAPSNFPHSLLPNHTRTVYHTPALVWGIGFFPLYACHPGVQESLLREWIARGHEIYLTEGKGQKIPFLFPPKVIYFLID